MNYKLLKLIKILRCKGIDIKFLSIGESHANIIMFVHQFSLFSGSRLKKDSIYSSCLMKK